MRNLWPWSEVRGVRGLSILFLFTQQHPPGSVLIFYFCKISVLILSFCMYLFCLFARGTKATGGATYKSPHLTTSQNKYKYRRSSRGNSIETATYILYGTRSNVP